MRKSNSTHHHQHQHFHQTKLLAINRIYQHSFRWRRVETSSASAIKHMAKDLINQHFHKWRRRAYMNYHQQQRKSISQIICVLIQHFHRWQRRGWWAPARTAPTLVGWFSNGSQILWWLYCYFSFFWGGGVCVLALVLSILMRIFTSDLFSGKMELGCEGGGWGTTWRGNYQMRKHIYLIISKENVQ